MPEEVRRRDKSCCGMFGYLELSSRQAVPIYGKVEGLIRKPRHLQLLGSNFNSSAVSTAHSRILKLSETAAPAGPEHSARIGKICGAKIISVRDFLGLNC